MQVSRPDPRPTALRHAHGRLARQQLVHLGATIGEDDNVYYSEATLGVWLAATLEVNFYDRDDHSRLRARFSGQGGGGATGGSETWGSAWATRPIDSLLGQRCRFYAVLLPFTLTISWATEQGEAVLAYVGGGLSIGSGILGGSGNFLLAGPEAPGLTAGAKSAPSACRPYRAGVP
jgi:hypothetical protein